jgi:Polysaccharide pyruvyl transferase
VAPEGKSAGSELGPSVAVLGMFDAADFGELLTGRIVERELRKRLPLARVDLYAPLGERRPVALDGGRPALSLGPPEGSRRAGLAARHDLVVIEGNVVHTRDDLFANAYGISVEEAERLQPSGFFVDGLGPELERRCPVAWHAVAVPFDLDPAGAVRVRRALESRRYVSVRDEQSRERLQAAAGAGEVPVLPHPAVLADRVFAADVLRKRVDYLRAMGWYPEEGSPVVVDDEAVAGESAAGTSVVVLPLEPPSQPAAVGPERMFRLPTEVTLEDVTAAIAHAGAFVGTSAAGQATALAFGIPSRAGSREELQARADSELDQLAALAEAEWAARASSRGTLSRLLRTLEQAEERYQALLRAYEARGERLVRERLRYAEIVEGLEAAAGGRSAEAVSREAELQTRLEMAEAAEAEARYELERLRSQAAGPAERA